MTAHETAPGTRTMADRRRRQDLAADHWAAMARTAALVRSLTALADRYEALDDPDTRAPLIAGLRAVTAAGRQLLLTSMPPVALVEPDPAALSVQERADLGSSRDAQAAQRDAAAELRDELARDRDERLRQVADDSDPDFPTRFLAACARDDAAGDRAAASADRRAAARDRAAAVAQESAADAGADGYPLLAQLAERSVIRQAQGVLMARDGLSVGEAFEALLRAADGPLTLHDIALQVVRRAEVPTGGGVA